MEDLERSLRAHPFMHDLAAEHVKFLVGCAQNVRFAPGEYVVREGDDEHALFLVRSGCIAVESNMPGQEAHVFETLGPGDLLGIWWLVKPGAKAGFDSRARDATLCFRLDGDCLKRKMDSDPVVGYAIATRLLERAYERLGRARLQKLDVYR
jgi:CRP-like cAMP-binding protein